MFVSTWVRNYHAERWFDAARPHSVILDGADPGLFHSIGNAPFEGGTLRLVTHHWSDNPMKGFDVYERVDRLIAAGELEDVELWVIGRWPQSSDWRAARTFPPTTGRELGDLLRRCHAYLTASRFEPGGMHHLEGAQCGLPLLYHEDGGGLVESASRYGIAYRDDVRAAIEQMRASYPELRRKVIENAPSGDATCAVYRATIQRLLTAAPSG